MRRAVRSVLIVAAIALPVGMWPTAPAAAHPLGNFTVNVAGSVIVRPQEVVVDYVVDMAEIPAFRERRTIDSDRNDRVDVGESLAYRAETCPRLAEGLDVRVDGRRVTVGATPTHALSFLDGAGGLPTMRLGCRLQAAIPSFVRAVDVSVIDRNFADAIGWRELTAAGDSTTIRGSNVPATSPTDGLRRYPADTLPPDVRSATFVAVPGGPSLGALPPIDGPPAWTDTTVGRDDGPLAAAVGVDHLTPLLVVTMFGIALGVGALHALGPGHGKTLIGAYLVGSGGSMRHAVGVGAAVSVMHTASVLGLGLLVLSAERLFAPDRVYPVLGLASGLIAVGLGSTLLVSRIHAASHRERGRDHGHGHGDAHDHGHDHGGGALSRRSLLALAFSGGILPSPSALVTLLAAVSVGRTALGLTLIAAFSVGLAASLIGIGVITLRARDLAERRLAHRAARLLPVASAAAIAAMGLFLTVRGAMQL